MKEINIDTFSMVDIILDWDLVFDSDPTPTIIKHLGFTPDQSTPE